MWWYFDGELQHGDTWSLESGSLPFTTITVLPLIQSAVYILPDTRNAAIVSKPSIHAAVSILNTYVFVGKSSKDWAVLYGILILVHPS